MDEIKGFHILVIVQGEWGERIFKNIEIRCPSDWIVARLRLSKSLPQIIDEPEEFLPKIMEQVDLVISLGETPQAGQLVSSVVRKSSAKAVICPVDSNVWLPPGMKNQLRKELEGMGVIAVFPKPFCSLTEIGDRYIDTFARYFGKPTLNIKCRNIIDEIVVKRGAPCGSTHYMAGESNGINIEDAKEKCALVAHHYPCLASMEHDTELNDTIMHVSGFLIMNEIERAIIECLRRNPWKGSQITPRERQA